jgi:hypothetical protein
MSDFNATYPEYAATARLDALRATECASRKKQYRT